MHAVPPLMTGIYMPPRSDFRIDESMFTYVPKQSKTSDSDAKTSNFASCESNSSVETLESIPKPVANEPKAVSEPKVWSDAPIIKEYESDSDDEHDDPQKDLKNKGIVNSGCSRHMTGNKAYFVDYQEYNGGPVSFGGNKGYITGKDTECLVLSPDFKLLDENQVLLRVHRQNNMYSFNLKNIVPTGCLACLIAKATMDESNKWHRRLGHINFKNLNKLVKGNLVRGKFDGKSDEGFLVRYSLNSKDFRPVRSENQANKIARPKEANHSEGTQDNIDTGYSEKEAKPTPEYYVLPLWSSYTSTIKSSEAKNRGLRQKEKEANDEAKALRKESAQVSTASPLRVFSAAESSYPDSTIYVDQDDSKIHALEDIYEHPSNGIFSNASFDHEGALVDFTNLETTVNFKIQKVWILVDLAYGKRAIRTKWVYKNKKDERGVVVRNKARLVLGLNIVLILYVLVLFALELMLLKTSRKCTKGLLLLVEEIIDSVVQVIAPTTVEQRLAKKNELKARGTLLMALLDKHQLKFNIYKDAKSLKEAIEKKVQKTLLKEQYENLGIDMHYLFTHFVSPLGEWEIARDAELNPFKDVLVCKKMVELLGAIPINLKVNGHLFSTSKKLRAFLIIIRDRLLWVPPPVVRPNGPAPRSIEELYQLSINGRGGPIATIPIQATDFRLRHHMIQQVQNSSQFHGLLGADANRHINKFLKITQYIKQNGVSDDALRLSLFPYSFTHNATAWHQDTINAAAGGTFMQKTPKECYYLIENMTAHYNHWDTSVTRDETSSVISSTTTTESPEMKMQSPSGSRSHPSNTIANLRGNVKSIITRSGVAYDGPTISPTSSPLPKVVKRETEATKDKVQTISLECTAHLQPPIVQVLIPELNKISLPDLTSTRMTLELATRSYAYSAGVTEDVFVQVGKFTFLSYFIVRDYDVDTRVPLILGRPFLRTAHALVDVHEEGLILRDDDEQLIFHADSTSKHPHKHGNDLTPFETSDSLLKEFFNELALLDPIPFGKEDNNFDFELDLREIKYLLHQDPSTESNIKTINLILKKFTDEPSLGYLPPPRDDDDDDDDLFNLKSDYDEWKKLLYGDCYKDIDSMNDKNKDSKMKSLVVEAHIVESNDLLPWLLDNDSTLPEESFESSVIASLSLSPFGNKEK
nr:ribonuclease H-like domain-containing protein [Tanacetum cinerariifolium]